MSVIVCCNDLAPNVCVFLSLRGPWNALSPIPENNAIAVDEQVILLIYGYNQLLFFISVFFCKWDVLPNCQKENLIYFNHGGLLWLLLVYFNLTDISSTYIMHINDGTLVRVFLYVQL